MPMPTFSADEVTNFLVTEALVHRALHEQKAAAEKQEREAWKSEWKNQPPKGL